MDHLSLLRKPTKTKEIRTLALQLRDAIRQLYKKSLRVYFQDKKVVKQRRINLGKKRAKASKNGKS